MGSGGRAGIIVSTRKPGFHCLGRANWRTDCKHIWIPMGDENETQILCMDDEWHLHLHDSFSCIWLSPILLHWVIVLLTSILPPQSKADQKGQLLVCDLDAPHHPSRRWRDVLCLSQGEPSLLNRTVSKGCRRAHRRRWHRGCFESPPCCSCQEVIMTLLGREATQRARTLRQFGSDGPEVTPSTVPSTASCSRIKRIATR